MACRVKQLLGEPYTQKEAEAAAGLRTDNGSRGDPTTTAGEDMEIEA